MDAGWLEEMKAGRVELRHALGGGPVLYELRAEAENQLSLCIHSLRRGDTYCGIWAYFMTGGGDVRQVQVRL